MKECSNCGCKRWYTDGFGDLRCGDCDISENAIIDKSKPLCSICRRRHGPEVKHECE